MQHCNISTMHIKSAYHLPMMSNPSLQRGILESPIVLDQWRGLFGSRPEDNWCTDYCWEFLWREDNIMTKIFRSRVYDVENLVLWGCGFLGSYILLKAAVIFLVVDYWRLLLCIVSITITILSYCPSRRCFSKRDRGVALYCVSPLRRSVDDLYHKAPSCNVSLWN